MKYSFHNSVRTRQLEFRQRDVSFCADDGAERERETEITLLSSFACSSVLLLTVNRV